MLKILCWCITVVSPWSSTGAYRWQLRTIWTILGSENRFWCHESGLNMVRLHFSFMRLRSRTVFLKMWDRHQVCQAQNMFIWLGVWQLVYTTMCFFILKFFLLFLRCFKNNVYSLLLVWTLYIFLFLYIDVIKCEVNVCLPCLVNLFTILKTFYMM